MNFIKTSLAIVILSVTTGAHASNLDNARSIENSTNTASAVSQNKIDKSADSALAMKASMEQLQEEVKNLTVYHDHLARLVENQAQEVTSIDQQITDIKQTRQGVVPLMYQMIDGLKTIVEHDKPIKRQARLVRVGKLETMMSQADISDAEKFRRILEAYQIEMDYGTKLAAYQAKITLADNKMIEVNVLHLGRIALVARSLNGSHYWSWNTAAKQWQVIDASEGANIDKAFAIADNQAAPSLITLPVSGVSTNVESK
ncbi:DUF3450 domain-containing protein [Photobacterium carnosum]|uniref:DUF3450 domain-containing protein n=1 Tax=Photobacterium carnosum TaxID=2023717 RepID=UPI001E5B690D|nr:DUF3450 domain-containing protein [Photobacterium carnosum]MCD9530495.1 DUF3450 family protein [Photobacterium carnosum]MCF2153073.1 DUF3450 family protein [Photobacterium carnosum]MCF2214833.1 DUF3450 family protein [Photobacterium carnosum]